MIVEISRGCASTGWIVSLCAIRELMVAESFSEKTHLEIFGENPENVLFAGVYEPRKCIARKVDGGYLIEDGFGCFVQVHFMPRGDISVWRLQMKMAISLIKS